MTHSETRSARPTTRRALASAAAATAMVLLAGCGGGSGEAGGTDSGELHGTPQSFTPPPEATPTLPDQFAAVDQFQPDSVMVAALETLFSYQPTVDLGQGEAAQRAAPLMDERFYRENAASMTALAPITGKRWQSWRGAGATVQARASITTDQHPPDLPASYSRVVAITVAAIAPDGAQIDTASWAAYATVTKLGVWRLSAVTVR
ncbi:hypothetical protein [Rhodococcus sp. BH5]|uniref:hypothetical protein n=1 Tax=Rhodococcus sp. BH5 TaxID=2871702 RepID=UPI0022CD9B5D|nr:hypothetical protein [Rhodococcus sp. BH5]MCZ9635039.1 hypothetical protein [Rhodococcus sp. BH5]